MYFSGVNRGMAFTKPGFYMTGLVCLAGVLATGSGSNALFLALGFGLSALVVSGILSERVMDRCRVTSLSSAELHVGMPASVSVTVENRHATWTCYGLEILGYRKKPRYKLLPSVWAADFSGSVLQIPASSHQTVDLKVGPLTRGRLRSLFLTQTTLYPFNLVRKYRVDSFPTDILVLPKLDESFLRELSHQSVQRLQLALNRMEFHSHRNLVTGDSHRWIDWKKSASLPTSEWVIKVFRDTVEKFGIVVAPEWGLLAGLPMAESYEAFVGRIYTACHFAEGTGRFWCLRLPDGDFIHASAYKTLFAELPAFKIPPASAPMWASFRKVKPQGALLVLAVTDSGHHWGSSAEEKVS